MRMRIGLSLVAFLSLCGGVAHAQETPKVDVFAGYSYVRDNPGPRSGDSFSLNGGSASVTYHIRIGSAASQISAAITTEISWEREWMEHSRRISSVPGSPIAATDILRRLPRLFSAWRIRELA